MPSFTYRTIDEPSEGLYREKGSKFLSFAFPVASQEAIKARLSGLRKTYFDATHHCYAWVLGADAENFRAADDGEPGHSAGDPILGQIRSAGLTNVLVVVVRYFGGTKLGVGGLITAYRAAAKEALANAKVVERKVTRDMEIHFAYPDTSAIMRIVKELDLEILGQEFGESCVLKVRYWALKSEMLTERLQLLIATGTSLSFSHLTSEGE